MKLKHEIIDLIMTCNYENYDQAIVNAIALAIKINIKRFRVEMGALIIQ